MLVFGVVSLLAAVGVAVATGGRDIRESLSGYEEVPTLSTPANGEFKASVSRWSQEIEYRLSYRDFETDVTQAHIHLGARAHERRRQRLPVQQPAEPAGRHARVPDARGDGQRDARARRRDRPGRRGGSAGSRPGHPAR